MPIPVKSTADFFVDVSPGVEDDVIVVARPDGRFFFGETDDLGSGNNNVQTYLFSSSATFHHFRLHGHNISIQEQQLGGAALRNGFEAFAWSEGAAGARDIYAEVLSTNGSNDDVITTRFLVNAGATAGDQHRPEVIGLGADRFAVVWQDSDNSRFKMAIFSISGQTILAPTDFGSAGSFTGPASPFRQIQMAELADGNFVVAYRPIGVSGSEARFSIFDRSGGIVVAETDVDVLTTGVGPPALAALADGRFTISNGASTARIFNADGTAATPLFPFMAGTAFPKIAALRDGRFMAVAESSGATREVTARVFFADGTPDGAAFQVNTVSTGIVSTGSVSPDVAALADGRVVVGWTSRENGTPDTKSAVFDPREAGLYGAASSLDDEWRGTNFSDTIFGAAGNDDLRSAGGNDYLYGEAGQDTLVGEAGDDRLYGGNDTDTLSGGADADLTLDGGLGNDLVLGGAGGDRIFGNAGNDTLNGDEGADFITGGAGNDTINGGADADTFLDGETGDDTINGGAGNDRIEGGSDNDTLNGDEGSDNITGGAGKDTISGGDEAVGGDAVLFGNAGDDTIFGGAGDDRIDGGTDVDFLRGDAGADYITAGAGMDFITGGLGADTLLYGEAGPDTFIYNDDLEGNDLIRDWVAADDTLRIDASAFGGGLVAGALAANRLVVGALPVADQAFGQFLYTTGTGQLTWDADGTGAGAAVLITRLFNGVAVNTLAVGDFDIVA